MKSQKVIFILYNLAWKTVLPFLKKNRSFKGSYKLRTSSDHFNKTDIWMHGASGGEAYIAVEILKRIKPSAALDILYTATTAQGLEIMNSFSKGSEINPKIKIHVTWFPFDIPKIIEKIILRTNPKLMVLLETEIWPGHLYMLKQYNIKTVIINARLSAKSFSRYLKTKLIWKQISPDKILATSVKDAERYKKIFDLKTEITTMPNIKFDSILTAREAQKDPGNLKTIIPSEIPFSILASIRKEEEIHLEKILKHLIKSFPEQIIAIFPKHLNRVEPLSNMLNNITSEFTEPGYKWKLRSKITKLVDKKTIILWDTFGELKQAYTYAVTAFVGGSLEPLGGQNFLEPIVCGAATVTGPYLNSFKWVEQDIFESNIVFKAQNAKQVGEFMVEKLNNPPDRDELKEKSLAYIQKNQGGTAISVKTIMDCFK